MGSRRHLATLLVALAVALPLVGVIGHDFVNFDDDINIARNPYLQLRAGDERNAVSSVRRAIELRPGWATAMNKLAWILATTTDPDLANRNEALRIAGAACQATGNRVPALLDTLAVAQAATSAFDTAIATATGALAQAESLHQTQIAAAIGRRIDLYRSGQPFHGPPGY